MDLIKIKDFIEQEFDNNAIPAISEYIKIPNLSRSYDPEWNTNGLLEKAAHFIKDWVLKQNVKNLDL